MQPLNDVMPEREVQSAFTDMGLDPAQLFQTELKENPYRDHHWEVKRTPTKITVNAIPSEEDLDHLFWEEWHTRDGQVHHQILTRWQPIRYDGIFHAPPRDEEHPQATAAKRWFVVDDDDMRPVLLCQ